MPRGGARIGAGRPKKDRMRALLTGARQRGPVGVVRPAVEDAGAAVLRPKGLEPDAAAMWDELAPLALHLGTLTVATAQAFADLCAFIVLERLMRMAPLAVGGADHRGMMQRVEMMRARFRLIADGKPVTKQDAPSDEWSEFDGPTLVKGASA